MSDYTRLLIDPAARQIDDLRPARGILKGLAMGIIGAGLLFLAAWCIWS